MLVNLNLAQTPKIQTQNKANVKFSGGGGGGDNYVPDKYVSRYGALDLDAARQLIKTSKASKPTKARKPKKAPGKPSMSIAEIAAEQLSIASRNGFGR